MIRTTIPRGLGSLGWSISKPLDVSIKDVLNIPKDVVNAVSTNVSNAFEDVVDLHTQVYQATRTNLEHGKEYAIQAAPIIAALPIPGAQFIGAGLLAIGTADAIHDSKEAAKQIDKQTEQANADAALFTQAALEKQAEQENNKIFGLPPFLVLGGVGVMAVILLRGKKGK